MFAAIAAGVAAAASLAPIQRMEAMRELGLKLGPYKSRGKGGRHVPQHAGARCVAWDKRAAKKRRNQLRAKGRR